MRNGCKWIAAHVRALVPALVLCVVEAGCGGPYLDSPMHPATATEASLSPPEGKALVVFLRPFDVQWNNVAIAEDNGDYIAAVGNSKRVAVAVTRGRHVYYAAIEGGGYPEAIVVEADAGKVYYVKTWALMPNLHNGHDPNTLLTVLRQKDKPTVDRLLHDTESWAVDPVVARAWLDKWGQREGWQDVLKHGKEQLAKYGEEDREKRTLHAEDGF
jgi:hypothetical protein